MTDYASHTDEELVALIREGDSGAEDALYTRYKQTVRSKARPYFLMGGDREDLVQEGMIGLYKAVCDFSPGKQASFRSFADLCITRQILSAVRTASRKKHSPLNNYVSLDQSESDEGPDARILPDMLARVCESSPEDIVIGNEFQNAVARDISDNLSDMERKILTLYVQGLSYQEISQTMDKPTKSIDNALQRIKKKLLPRIRSLF